MKKILLSLSAFALISTTVVADRLLNKDFQNLSY